MKIINSLKWKDKLYNFIVLPTEREEIKRQGAKLQILPSFISKKSFKKEIINTWIKIYVKSYIIDF